MLRSKFITFTSPKKEDLNWRQITLANAELFCLNSVKQGPINQVTNTRHLDVLFVKMYLFN